MESSTLNSNMTFDDEEFRTLNYKTGLIIVPGFIATFTIYVTLKIFLKNRHRLETFHLFIINELIGKVDNSLTNYSFLIMQIWLL